jgi:hypothetical protein
MMIMTIEMVINDDKIDDSDNNERDDDDDDHNLGHKFEHSFPLISSLRSYVSIVGHNICAVR